MQNISIHQGFRWNAQNTRIVETTVSNMAQHCENDVEPILEFTLETISYIPLTFYRPTLKFYNLRTSNLILYSKNSSFKYLISVRLFMR